MTEDIKFTPAQLEQLVEQGKQRAKAPVPPTLAEVEKQLEVERNADVQEVVVSIPRHILASIKRTAEYRNLSVEQLALDLLVESLNTAVSKPWIQGPSKMSGRQVSARKVTGPSFARKDL